MVIMTESEKNDTLLFIYGTLKRGHCRHQAMAGQQFIADVATEPHYRLVSCGNYPGLVHAVNGKGLSIRGELWNVNEACLDRLDRIEGVDEQLYERTAVKLSGQYASLDVQTYYFLGPSENLPDIGNAW